VLEQQRLTTSSPVGAGVLRFGVSPEQVHQLLGKPRLARSDPGRLREMYGVSPALTFKGNDKDLELVEIGFAKDAEEDVTFRGTDLFSAERRAILASLCNDDADPRDVAGTLVFPELGISLTGFHGDHGAGVTAFAPGTWDETLERSTPFKLR
jgi:hypothetical protein